MGFIEGLVIGAVAGAVFGIFFMRIRANAAKVETVVTKATAVEQKVEAVVDAAKEAVKK